MFLRLENKANDENILIIIVKQFHNGIFKVT